MNLFAYGTLMYSDILSNVIGREFPGTIRLATVMGWRRIRVGPWMAFPGLDAQLEGFLMTDLDEKDFERLDMYEGVDNGFYERCSVMALLDSGKFEDAIMYRNGPAYRRIPTDEVLGS